jgi:outer membrane protein OmpA-like peptidoglycan-associated protein
MKLIKVATLTLALLTIGSSVQGQRFLKRLGEAAQNAAENAAVRKTEQKTDNAVSSGIDKATDKNTYKGKGKKKKNKKSDNNDADDSDADDSDASAASTGSATGAAGGNAENEAAENAESPKALEMTYAKSDFVPGDEIIFEDLLIGEKLGEFPSMWDLEQGNAEVAQINGENAIALIGYTVIIPLMNKKEYLPDVFTIEFDILSTGSTASEIGFGPNRIFILRDYLHENESDFHFGWKKPDNSEGSQSHSVKTSGHQWNHVSISFNKRALKYYFNGERILNVPNAKAPKNFWFWADDGNTYIKNVRLAAGAIPLYDRMMSDGKFITYGITFDVGKSTIKPESMGEINRIVKLMTENPTLKFSVEGHTDNTGSAATNQTLSDARSKAVVDKLVEQGIAKDRLTSAGKGQNAPIADNTTDEGRAKNRRVEFVKL